MPIPRSLPRLGSASASSKDLPTPTVLANRYSLGNKLGSGSFGSVYVVTDLKSNDRKVVKKISVGEIKPDETVEAVREAALLAQLVHPAIVKFHDSFLEGEFFCIVTECCEGGDLDHMISQLKETGTTLEEDLVLDWFVQLTNAIWYIHSRRVLHRDIKTRNIFLKENRVKLGDFGISRILMGTADYATTFIGTPYYMSPEVLKHDGYNTKSDIWSLGVVLFELCTLEHAFRADNVMAVMYKIVQGESPQLGERFDPALRVLCSRMMDKDPQNRPTASEILQDSFIKSHMERLNQRLTLKLDSTMVPGAAQDIARVLSPVRMHQLMPSKETEHQQEKPLTPREKMLLRKSQKADEEAERIKAAAAQNFVDNQKRYGKERTRKKSKSLPPWVKEHPQVFDNTGFSLTMDISQTSGSTMETSLQSPPPASQVHPAGGWGYIPKERIFKEEEERMDIESKASRDMDSIAVPEDPHLAEAHYTQFQDFEVGLSSDPCSESDEEYKAMIGYISEALELPDQTAASLPSSARQQAASSQPSHDDWSPFSPLARERRISLLEVEGKRVLGEEVFLQVYEYLKAARHKLAGQISEAAIMEGLKSITSNTRDCFIVDQLVFLEKRD